jgi:hypothetical protein
VGTYENSGNVQSDFVTYNPNLYRRKSLEVNLVTGVADGYEGWDYAQNGYLPILGVSAKWINLIAEKMALAGRHVRLAGACLSPRTAEEAVLEGMRAPLAI